MPFPDRDPACRRLVAHCATPFLNLTMTWVYGQIRHHSRYRAVVLTQEARNRGAFPVDNLQDAAGWPLPRRLANRAARRLTGQYAFYGGILRREGAVLVHAHFGQEGYRCLGARRHADVPLVTTFYGMDASSMLRDATWLRRFRRLFTEGHLFLAEGPHLAQRLADAGCAAEKLRVQKLGVDLEVIPFHPDRDAADGRPVVLMCGYFNEKKGFPFGVRAFARIAASHPQARLHIIGDGPQRPAIEAAVRDCGLGDRATFLGMLGGGEYRACLLESHLLLHPSVTAADGDTEGGAPVVVIEAQASGLPVVSSRHADIPEVAPEGRCSLLADEGDVEGLAAALDALLSDEGMRRRLGAAGRRHVEEHHDAVRQGERLEDLYDEVAA
ncbi:MAG: glycosyltransferase [Planctomycetota bacterium]